MHAPGNTPYAQPPFMPIYTMGPKVGNKEIYNIQYMFVCFIEIDRKKSSNLTLFLGNSNKQYVYKNYKRVMKILH